MSSSVSGESMKDKSKKKYSKFTQEELEQINRLFAENGFYPDVNEVREFAKSSGIKVIKLENWFKYNRRKMAYHGNLMTYRKRRVFRHQDLDYLRNFFEEKPYPKSSQYKEIAKKINAPLQQVINWFANQRKKYSKSKGSCSKNECTNDSMYQIDDSSSSMIKLEEDSNNLVSKQVECPLHQTEENSSPSKKQHFLVKNKRISKTNSSKLSKPVHQKSPTCDDHGSNLKELTKENLRMLGGMDQNMLNWQKMGGFDAAFAQRLSLHSQLSAGMASRNASLLNYNMMLNQQKNVKFNPTQQQHEEMELRKDAFLKMLNMQKKLSYFNNLFNNKQMRDYYMMQAKFAELRDLQGRSNMNQSPLPFYYQNGSYLANAQSGHQSNFWQAAQNYCNTANNAINALGNIANLTNSGSNTLINSENAVNLALLNKNFGSSSEVKLNQSENIIKSISQSVVAPLSTKVEEL